MQIFLSSTLTKKIREVNVNNINLDLNEYENPEKDLTISETLKKTENNEKINKKEKKKIVKLNKTLKIVPAEGVKKNKTKKVKRLVLEK